MAALQARRPPERGSDQQRNGEQRPHDADRREAAPASIACRTLIEIARRSLAQKTRKALQRTMQRSRRTSLRRTDDGRDPTSVIVRSDSLITPACRRRGGQARRPSLHHAHLRSVPDLSPRDGAPGDATADRPPRLTELWARASTICLHALDLRGCVPAVSVEGTATTSED